MDLKTFVLSQVLPETYYKKRFPQWNERSRPNVLCPWHDDHKESLSVGLKNGGARCHACGESIGNIVHFESKRLQCEETDTASKLYSEFIRPLVPDSLLETYQQALASNQRVRSIIESDCGITQEGVELFALGWDAASKRLVIPIYDRWSQLVNLRLYKPPHFRTPSDEKYKVLNLKGFGGLDLFSWPHFIEFTLAKPVFIMPSEKECILGILHGLQSVTATAGENAWKEEWNELFVGYDICVMPQRDNLGREAAAKRLASLQTVANFSCILEPPTKHKDFADYIIKDRGQGFHVLAEFQRRKSEHGTPPLVSGNSNGKIVAESLIPSSSDAPTKPDYYSSDLVELASIGSDPSMLNHIVKTTGIVCAKATSTYTIPWKFKIKTKTDAQRFYSIPIGRSLLSFIKASDAYIVNAIRDLLGNAKADVQPYDSVVATEVEIIPTASVDKDVRYVTQRCYYIGKCIDANCPYELEIIPTTDSRTQETVGIVVKANPIARAVESSSFSEEELATLQIFKPHDDESSYDKLIGLADEISRHHTKIYNRPDWHIVALLTWLSPLGFAFPLEKEIQRGWINSLAVGDTQTGKSKVAETLQRLFQSGSFINAENCTYVGLVGGAIKMGSGQFMLRWGRIPLCDKQLVVIEELSGLSVDEISNMSDVRSRGIARLDKGGISAETNARTRLLALSNVRPVNKTLAAYLSGVKAIQELIGHGEDIARFDLIITLVDAEVSIETINRPFSNRGLKDAIPTELLQKLCQFIWALKPEQIKITTDAYHLCLDETKRLSAIYHPSIPVFKGGSGRYKIARIAAAIACMQFSWNGKVISVQEEHIEAATQLLESLYNKPSFGYLEWSEQMFDRDGVKDSGLLDEEIVTILKQSKRRGKVLETLLHSGKFTRDELCAVASLQIMTADQLIGGWIREHVVRKGEANTWEITQAGRKWMITHLLDSPL